jgi:hypothetical protein
VSFKSFAFALVLAFYLIYSPEFVLLCAGEMLPLTGAEMRKYLAELERSKNPDGYVSSSPGGVSLRRLKRKESVKGDSGVIEVDDLENAGGGNAPTPAASPSSKKARTGRGSKPSSSRPPSGKEIGGTSLNDDVMDSFWHSGFDIRRYNTILVFLGVDSFWPLGL